MESKNMTTQLLGRDGGIMRRRMLEYDWAKTDMGPLSTWNPQLLAIVRIMLDCKFPIHMYLGFSLYLVYNDAYIPIAGGEDELGRRAQDKWATLWDDFVGPQLTAAINGETRRYQNEVFALPRPDGSKEEGMFDFSYGPVRLADGRIIAIISPVLDVTKSVMSERRLSIIKDITMNHWAFYPLDRAHIRVMEILSNDVNDIPFAMIYVANQKGTKFNLKAACGIQHPHDACPTKLVVEKRAIWPIDDILKSDVGSLYHIDIEGRFSSPFSGGPFNVQPKKAIAVHLNAQNRRAILIVGISAIIPLDETYCGFVKLLADQIQIVSNVVLCHQIAKMATVNLTKTDSTKTSFYQAMSHEFRTPLSLILGPLQDSLADTLHPLNVYQRERQMMMTKNAKRLLRLVNSLLEVTTIDANHACFQPMDLPKFSGELASVFRAAMERAKLNFVVNIVSAGEIVYVDRDMWEKVVFNLLSNALKYTLKGTVEVSSQREGDQFLFLVRDTGIGIPEEEIPKMFDRFHRVESAHGRDQVGTGVGLSLAAELVRLHGGTIKVTSVLGEGSCFTVSLPIGSSHLPPHQVVVETNDEISNGFVEHALNSLGTPTSGIHGSAGSSQNASPMDSPNQSPGGSPIVHARLKSLAEYLPTRRRGSSPTSPASRSPLMGRHPASNSDLNLIAASRRLAESRSMPDMKIEKVENIEIPLSRAAATTIQQKRQQYIETSKRNAYSENQLYLSPMLYSNRPKDTVLIVESDVDARSYLSSFISEIWNVEVAHDISSALVLIRGLYPPNLVLTDRIVSEDGVELLQYKSEKALASIPVVLLSSRTGEEARVEGLRAGADDYIVKPFSTKEVIIRINLHLQLSHMRQQLEEKVALRARDLLHANRALSTRILQRDSAESALRESENSYKLLATVSPVGIFSADASGTTTYLNERWYEMTSFKLKDTETAGWLTGIHQHDKTRITTIWTRVIHEKRPFVGEFRYVRPDGSILWVLSQALPDIADDNTVRGFVGTITDISERKNLEKERVAALKSAELEQRKRVEEAEKQRKFLENFIDTICHETRNPLNGIFNNNDLLRTGLKNRDEILDEISTHPEFAEVSKELKSQRNFDFEAISAIEICAKQQQTISDDVLNLSRLDAHKLTLLMSPFKLKETIDAAIRGLQLELSAKNIETFVKAPLEDFNLKGDAARTKQVFSTLILRSMKALQKSTVKSTSNMLATIQCRNLRPMLSRKSQSPLRGNCTHRRNQHQIIESNQDEISFSEAVTVKWKEMEQLVQEGRLKEAINYFWDPINSSAIRIRALTIALQTRDERAGAMIYDMKAREMANLLDNLEVDENMNAIRLLVQLSAASHRTFYRFWERCFVFFRKFDTPENILDLVVNHILPSGMDVDFITWLQILRACKPNPTYFSLALHLAIEDGVKVEHLLWNIAQTDDRRPGTLFDLELTWMVYEQLFREDQHIPISSEAYALVIRAAATFGTDPLCIERVLYSMSEQGFEFKPIHFRNALEGLSRMGDGPQLEVVIAEMKAAKIRFKERDIDIQFRLPCLLRQGKLQEANQMYEKLVNSGPMDAALLHWGISMNIQQKKIGHALHILKQIPENAITWEESWDLLIETLAKDLQIARTAAVRKQKQIAVDNGLTIKHRIIDRPSVPEYFYRTSQERFNLNIPERQSDDQYTVSDEKIYAPFRQVNPNWMDAEAIEQITKEHQRMTSET
eukprot:TRINITY_DN6926_c0_g1_i5.p1 TRINITY_DN6926_c0_g1~~TRINITY_DN6926_c0_g1_i5.p1  ORF type:complete len:1713 (+),score=502.18 TRINITY_DN6926_c0_g1_i5:57-5195(+)